MGQRFVLFGLASASFCLPAERVQEVFALPAIEPSVRSSPLLRGAINLRGRLLPILDLRPVFDLPLRADNVRDVVIVIGNGGPVFGVIAEELGELSEFPTEATRPSQPPHALAPSTAVDGSTLRPIVDVNEVSRLLAAP